MAVDENATYDDFKNWVMRTGQTELMETTRESFARTAINYALRESSKGNDAPINYIVSKFSPDPTMEGNHVVRIKSFVDSFTSMVLDGVTPAFFKSPASWEFLVHSVRFSPIREQEELCNMLIRMVDGRDQKIAESAMGTIEKIMVWPTDYPQMNPVGYKIKLASVIMREVERSEQFENQFNKICDQIFSTQNKTLIRHRLSEPADVFIKLVKNRDAIKQDAKRNRLLGSSLDKAFEFAIEGNKNAVATAPKNTAKNTR